MSIKPIGGGNVIDFSAMRERITGEKPGTFKSLISGAHSLFGDRSVRGADPYAPVDAGLGAVLQQRPEGSRVARTPIGTALQQPASLEGSAQRVADARLDLDMKLAKLNHLGLQMDEVEAELKSFEEGIA